MAGIDDLLAGNERFVASFDAGDLPIRAGKATLVVSCVDARVDPMAAFDAELGDILVLRNVGGRVTDDILAQLGMLSALMSSVPDAKPPAVLVMHHTNCGTARFADPELRQMAAQRAGVPVEAVDAIVVEDPRVTVAEDVERLRSAMPPGARVEGRVYDVTTGRAIPV